MKFVITGGPSSGKTTVLELLAKRGFPTINEKATEIIKEGKLHPLRSYKEFNDEVIWRYLKAELNISDDPFEIVFQDRGCFDPLAYSVMDGAAPPDALRWVTVPRYICAFLMEPLGEFVEDGIRFENLEYARRLTPILETAYLSAGVRVIRVPVLSPEARTVFILDHVSLLFGGLLAA